MIIALEGADAAGKATQAKILVECLRAAGHVVESMSFPNYETPTGKLILEMLKGTRELGLWGNIVIGPYSFEGRLQRDAGTANALVLQALMTANRYEQFEKLRGWGCGFSHDDEKAGKVPAWFYKAIETGKEAVLVLDRYWLSGLVYGMADGLDREWLLAIHAALPPVHHIFLDVDRAEAVHRRPELRDRFERDEKKQAQVRELYLAECAQGPLRRVDGLGTVEEVAARVWAAVAKLIA